MYEAAFSAVCKSVYLMKCDMIRTSLNIENIRHITLSTVKSLTIIATFWEEKLVGRPHPNKIEKIETKRESLLWLHLRRVGKGGVSLDYERGGKQEWHILRRVGKGGVSLDYERGDYINSM